MGCTPSNTTNQGDEMKSSPTNTEERMQSKKVKPLLSKRDARRERCGASFTRYTHTCGDVPVPLHTHGSWLCAEHWFKLVEGYT
jgi:hypothetical protein